MEQEIFNSPENYFITGPGGTGKTWIVKQLELLWFKNNTVYVLLAPTGVAAINIGGKTIHSFFGIGLAKGTDDELLKMCRMRGAARKIMALEVMVIDEVSMLSAELMETLNWICQQVRRNIHPFGGIKLVLTGDFCQLKSVTGRFAFMSDAWKSLNLKVIQLDEPKRFNDNSYWKMLNRARIGKLKMKDVNRLKERVEAYKTYDKGQMIQPTILFSHKTNVEELNTRKLDELAAQEYAYKAQDSPASDPEVLATLAQQVLKLKVGAQVMCTRNLSIETGICNGSRGVITDCHPESVQVFFKNGVTLELGYYLFEYEGRGYKWSRLQIPLMLAWACTVHKAQGLTLDLAVLDVGPSIFCAGQAYVALSRVKNYDSLFLSEFDETRVFADKHAVAFYNELS